MNIENEMLSLGVDVQGRPQKIASRDGAVKIPIDPHGMTHAFEVDLRDGDGRVTRVVPDGPPDMQVGGSETEQALALTWDVAGEWGSLAFRGRVSLPEGGRLSAWTCEIENRSRAAVWQVAWPRVSGLTAFRELEGPDWLAGPTGTGEKTPDPVDFVNRHEAVIPGWARQQFGAFDTEGGPADIAYTYPGMWAMQFLTYYHPAAGGIYLAAHDPGALVKRFGLYADGPGRRHAVLAMKQYPEDRTALGQDFRSLYPTMIGVHRGEWWNASALYRAWALEQAWCSAGPTGERDDIPDWVRDLDVWYWNIHHLAQRNHPVDIVPAVERLQERFDCKLAVHWYAYNGEHTCNNMWRDPDTFPYTPGVREALCDGVEQLHRMGAHVIPYINCRLVSPLGKAFREMDGKKWAATDENGNVADEWPRVGITMCPTARPFHDLLRRLTNRLVDKIGMDGAYLDQPTSCYAVPCFHPDHDHPPGGHDHWYRGYRELLTRIRKDLKARSGDNVMTSEGQIECFLDLFDLDLGWHVSSLSSTVGNADALPIPMFQSVYHDYHMTYGTSSCMDLKASKQSFEQFAFAEALCLVSGTQLQISGVFADNVDSDALQPQLDYLETLLAARKAAHDWLNAGVWQPPLPLQCDRVDVGGGEKERVHRDLPAVVSGCFKLGATTCMVLVNHTEASRGITVTIDPGVYGVEDDTVCLTRVHPDAGLLAGPSGGNLEWAGVLAGRSAHVWMLARAE